MKISPDRFITLFAALKMIPGVKLLIAKEKLENIQSNLCMGAVGKGIEKYECGSLSLCYDDFKELFLGDDYKTPRISPKGAKSLLLFCQEGLFDRKSSEEPVELLRYIASEDEIRKAQYESDNEKRRIEALILTPEVIEEKEFSYGLLNNVFINRFGLGREQWSMQIGGIVVNKSVSIYKSNSGKSSDADVIFTWQGSDGQSHRLGKVSRYIGNRKNDSERNWGLPE